MIKFATIAFGILVTTGAAAQDQWSQVKAETAADMQRIRECTVKGDCSVTEAKISSIITIAKTLPPSLRVRYVNREVNSAIRYKKDVGDVWSAPIVSFEHGGDCEDYAIAKYAILNETGFHDIQLITNLVYRTGTGHANLNVQVDFEVYVLDNMSNIVSLRRDMNLFLKINGIYY